MLVPEEEAPQEEDLDGDTMVKDEGSFRSDAGVSSTAVSPEPILIPAPYDLDFTPPVHQSCGVPPESCQDRWVCQSLSVQFSPCYMPGVGIASCRAWNVTGQYHKVCVHTSSSGSGSDEDCLFDELAASQDAQSVGWQASSYTNRGGRT